jgi:hypothetical protein
MTGGHKTRAGIIALEPSRGSCPALTLQFPAPGVSGVLLVTLSLCEWQRIAQQIAEATTAIAS